MTKDKKERPRWRIAPRGHGHAVLERVEGDYELIWRTLPTRREAEEWLRDAAPETRRKEVTHDRDKRRS